MAVFTCKICGGSLEITPNQSIAVCEYCGTKQTLPKLGDDRKATLYDRAGHFRRNNDYDKAMGIYEQILNEDPSDAESYWSLVLCRYGIEYVEDPDTRSRVITVNRAQFTSIFDDEDYKSALQYADAAQRELYESEAETINGIQKGILAISQQEEPFDVFICYKETDANGRRTQDSVLATELYHELTREGFRVFFSRITLEDKLGIAYEPYIFAALNSAKVMVALGTRAEHFNAVWVRNEWSRYLSLIKNGAKKTLIPAYRGMDPYDLPDEFSHLQAQDMSKLGFMQDLVHGIRKIVAEKEETPVSFRPHAAQPAASGTIQISALLERGYISLEGRDWKKAESFFEQVLNYDPKNAEAYLGKLLCQYKLPNKEALRNGTRRLEKNGNYALALRFADAPLHRFLTECIQKFKKNRKEKKLKTGTTWIFVFACLFTLLFCLCIISFACYIPIISTIFQMPLLPLLFCSGSLTLFQCFFWLLKKKGKKPSKAVHILHWSCFALTAISSAVSFIWWCCLNHAYYDITFFTCTVLCYECITILIFLYGALFLYQKRKLYRVVRGCAFAGIAIFTLCLVFLIYISPLQFQKLSDGSYSLRGSRAPISGQLVVPEQHKNHSVTEIDHRAFAYCELLTSVTIPDSVTSIGEYSFYYCDRLTNVSIPDSVKKIGTAAFAYCNDLTDVPLPNGITAIEYRTFYGCVSLTNITIPNSVTYIGSGAFADCSGLTSITIPNSVTAIGGGAFANCSGLTSITIPNSVTSIGKGALYNCNHLTAITLPLVLDDFWDIFGRYYNEDISSSLKTVVITGGTTIEDHTFSNCKNLTSVTIPNSVISIGKYAFYNCSNLTSITFQGTGQEWKNIAKNDSWDSASNISTIYCTDVKIYKR